MVTPMLQLSSSFTGKVRLAGTINDGPVVTRLPSVEELQVFSLLSTRSWTRRRKKKPTAITTTTGKFPAGQFQWTTSESVASYRNTAIPPRRGDETGERNGGGRRQNQND